MVTPGPIVLDTADVPDVDALRRSRLRANDLIHERGEVRLQRLDARTRPCRSAAWTLPPLSTRNSILPAFVSRTALATLNVTVPALGFGISPRGPSTRPSCAELAHLVGRGDQDVEVEPAVLDLLRCTRCRRSRRPRASASRALSPTAMTSTRTVLPVPAGSTTVPRTT